MYYIECRKNLYIRRKKECYSLAEQRDKARSEDRAAWKPKGHLGDTQTQSVDKISFLLKLSKFQFWLSFLCLIFSVCYLQWLTWPSTRSQWPGWRSFRRQPSLPAPVQTGLSGKLNLNLDRTQKTNLNYFHVHLLLCWNVTSRTKNKSILFKSAMKTTLWPDNHTLLVGTVYLYLKG